MSHLMNELRVKQALAVSLKHHLMSQDGWRSLACTQESLARGVSDRAAYKFHHIPFLDQTYHLFCIFIKDTHPLSDASRLIV